MQNTVKIMVEKLIKEGLDIDIMLKASVLSIKDIENISPTAYGMMECM